MKTKRKTPSRESIISHLAIIHTWADFALEKGYGLGWMQLEHIAEWTIDAINELKKQEDKP